MSRNERSSPHCGSGSNDIALLILARLSSYQVRWLNTQCDNLKREKGKLLTEIFGEWLVRHSDDVIQAGNLGDIVCVALDEFINRHRDEFLPVDLEA